MEAKSERRLSISVHEKRCCEVGMICAKPAFILKIAENKLTVEKEEQTEKCE